MTAGKDRHILENDYDKQARRHSRGFEELRFMREEYSKFLTDGSTLRCQGTCADTSSRFTHFYQCYNKAIFDRDGKHYCKIHDPVEKKRKSDAREQLWRAALKRDSEAAKKEQARNKTFTKLVDGLELALSRVVREIAKDKGTEAAAILPELESLLEKAKSLL